MEHDKIILLRNVFFPRIHHRHHICAFLFHRDVRSLGYVDLMDDALLQDR
jgi:hypothetical protein